MTPETLDLFHAVATADATSLQRALAAGADVNATDDKGRNVASHAALGDAIYAIDAPIQPRLSERRLAILQIVLQQPDLSLYSLNAPMAWAGGVTLLGLMSWLNMPTEIMCLLEFTQGLVEVNAMDEQGATPLMYAARDGSLQVVQRLLGHGARADLKDAGRRSAIQYALPHPQIMWLCEGALRRERFKEPEFLSPSTPSRTGAYPLTIPSPHSQADSLADYLFFSTPSDSLLTPPPSTYFDNAELRRMFDALLRAVRAENIDTLYTLLFSAPPADNVDALETQSESAMPSPRPLLVNLRDSTGLTLVHHAISQRPHPSIPILDALYRAGADVGFYSTLGFTPLHHLARTARDDTKPPKDDGDGSRPLLAAHTHPLYTFTAHFVRDLRAPLGATDGKGETPLHAAAEHGRSVSVLQAMLDCDGKFAGNEAVRESRNDRGLRPVDVAKPEFLPLFSGVQQAHVHDSGSQPLHAESTLFQNQGQLLRPSNSPLLVRPSSAGLELVKKESNLSLGSKSSGSSSTSSGTHSQGSHQSHHNHQLQPPSTPTQRLRTPRTTQPAGSIHTVQDSYAPIDVPACTLDILSSLSFCTSTLRAYTQPDPNVPEQNMAFLPDYSALSDTLLFTRDLTSHVLEHWRLRLGTAWDEFERARRELEKAHALRERVGTQVRKLAGCPGASAQGVREGAEGQGIGKSMRHTAVQTHSDDFPNATTPVVDGTDVTQDDPAHAVRISVYARMEKEDLQELVTSENDAAFEGLMRGRAEAGEVREGGRLSTWYIDVGGARERGERKDEGDLLSGWVRDGMKLHSLRLEIVKELEEGGTGMVGREARVQLPVKTEIQDMHSPTDGGVLGSTGGKLRSASRVLQRTDKDLESILVQLGQVQHSFARAQQSVKRAGELVEQAIKAREDTLDALIRIRPQLDVVPPASSRLPPILERSPDIRPGTFPVLQPINDNSSLSNLVASAPVEEPRVLRRLLTHRLAQHTERLFDDLQKAIVWLRIVREVLRGLRRRACIEH